MEPKHFTYVLHARAWQLRAILQKRIITSRTRSHVNTTLSCPKWWPNRNHRNCPISMNLARP